MNNAHNYRATSSAWTGRAPRSTCERWPADPVSIRSSIWRRLLVWFCGF